MPVNGPLKKFLSIRAIFLLTVILIIAIILINTVNSIYEKQKMIKYYLIEFEQNIVSLQINYDIDLNEYNSKIIYNNLAIHLKDYNDIFRISNYSIITHNINEINMNFNQINITNNLKKCTDLLKTYEFSEYNILYNNDIIRDSLDYLE